MWLITAGFFVAAAMLPSFSVAQPAPAFQRPTCTPSAACADAWLVALQASRPSRTAHVLLAERAKAASLRSDSQMANTLFSQALRLTSAIPPRQRAPRQRPVKPDRDPLGDSLPYPEPCDDPIRCVLITAATPGLAPTIADALRQWQPDQRSHRLWADVIYRLATSDPQAARVILDAMPAQFRPEIYRYLVSTLFEQDRGPQIAELFRGLVISPSTDAENDRWAASVLAFDGRLDDALALSSTTEFGDQLVVQEYFRGSNPANRADRAASVLALRQAGRLSDKVVAAGLPILVMTGGLVEAVSIATALRPYQDGVAKDVARGLMIEVVRLSLIGQTSDADALIASLGLPDDLDLDLQQAKQASICIASGSPVAQCLADAETEQSYITALSLADARVIVPGWNRSRQGQAVAATLATLSESSLRSMSAPELFEDFLKAHDWQAAFELARLLQRQDRETHYGFELTLLNTALAVETVAIPALVAEAAAQQRALMRVRPEFRSAEVFYEFAIVLARVGDYRGALQMVEDAPSEGFYPKTAPRMCIAGWAAENGDWDRAFEITNDLEQDAKRDDNGARDRGLFGEDPIRLSNPERGNLLESLVERTWLMLASGGAKRGDGCL